MNTRNILPVRTTLYNQDHRLGIDSNQDFSTFSRNFDLNIYRLPMKGCQHDDDKDVMKKTCALHFQFLLRTAFKISEVTIICTFIVATKFGFCIYLYFFSKNSVVSVNICIRNVGFQDIFAMWFFSTQMVIWSRVVLLFYFCFDVLSENTNQGPTYV